MQIEPEVLSNQKRRVQIAEIIATLVRNDVERATIATEFGPLLQQNFQRLRELFRNFIGRVVVVVVIVVVRVVVIAIAAVTVVIHFDH